VCQVVPNSKSEVAGGLGTEVDLWHCQQVVGSSTVGKAYDCAAKTHKHPIKIVGLPTFLYIKNSFYIDKTRLKAL
jgi:hypothetical protein